MRILHFITSIDRSSGGTSSYMQLLTKELGRLVELHVATHWSENMLSLENCQIHYLPGNTFGWGMKKAWLKLLDEIKPDIVHMNCCWQPEISMAQRWAKQNGYKVVLTPHGMLEPWDIKKNYWTKKLPAILLYQRKAVKQSDVIVATADSEAKNLQTLGWNKNVAIVPNGIVVDDVNMKTSWKRNKQIMMLALLRPNKGADLLIKAVAKLKDELEGWKVLIVGPDTEGYGAILQGMIDSHSVGDIVSLYGSAYGDDKWRLYRESDLFVLPTLNENFGIVIAESYLCGTPVITTKGAPWQIIEEEKIGWWIDRDEEALVNSLRDFLYKTDEEQSNMGTKGRQLVESLYSSKTVAKQMLAVYKWILEEGGKPDCVYD